MQVTDRCEYRKRYMEADLQLLADKQTCTHTRRHAWQTNRHEEDMPIKVQLAKRRAGGHNYVCTDKEYRQATNMDDKNNHAGR
jgi:hypothetical protein